MKRELVPLPDLRHEIHDLTVQKHSSGLSPPEEEILERLEVQELYVTGAEISCSGSSNK